MQIKCLSYEEYKDKYHIMKKILVTLLCIIGISFNSGCGLPFNPISPIISFYLTWKEGEARKHYRYDHKTVYKAVKRSLSSLEYAITTDEENESGYYIVADSNDRFKITVEKVEPEITLLKIRVNFMGDKPYAELIYKEVDNQLNVIDYKRRKGFFRRFLQK